MMKKLVFFAFIILIIFFAIPPKGFSNLFKEETENYQVIPDEAIRLRILANSDGEEDQELKRAVRDKVNGEISKWVEHIDDIDEARQLIESRLDEIDHMVAATLKEAGSTDDYEVEYGKNVTFPTKLYGSYVYPAGEYEAVLISIGEGQGSNWWCVLFPPLCFLDFSNGISVAEASTEDMDLEAEEKKEEEEEVKVKFFLFDLFNWL